MSLLLQKNFFELFGLSVSYSIDGDKLADLYRQLQRQFHPDRFASASDYEKRIALQYATYINEAYDSLKSPLPRAQYLMELAGFSQKDHTMQNDTVFLLQQMEWRDQLGSATSCEQVDKLIYDTQAVESEYLQIFDEAYQEKNYDDAQLNIDKLQFVSKFETELQMRKQSFA